LNEKETAIPSLLFSYEQFKEFLLLQVDGTLITQHAKTVMQEMLVSAKDPKVVIEEKGLKPVDASQVEVWVKEFFDNNANVFADLKS